MPSWCMWWLQGWVADQRSQIVYTCVRSSMCMHRTFEGFVTFTVLSIHGVCQLVLVCCTTHTTSKTKYIRVESPQHPWGFYWG